MAVRTYAEEVAFLRAKMQEARDGRDAASLEALGARLQALMLGAGVVPGGAPAPAAETKIEKTERLIGEAESANDSQSAEVLKVRLAYLKKHTRADNWYSEPVESDPLAGVPPLASNAGRPDDITVDNPPIAATDAARSLAALNGIDLADVPYDMTVGRVVKNDVYRHMRTLRAAAAVPPEPGPSAEPRSGAEEPPRGRAERSLQGEPKTAPEEPTDGEAVK